MRTLSNAPCADPTVATAMPLTTPWAPTAMPLVSAAVSESLPEAVPLRS